MAKQLVQAKLYLDVIPEEMKEFNQWVIWREIERENGKMGKVPHHPIMAYPASVVNPKHWGSFEELQEGEELYCLHTAGFVFSNKDPYVGIDLDDCIDQETNKIEGWAWGLVSQLNSYTEISPSGKGLHVIVKGNLPGSGKRKSKVEMYGQKRFFTMTGNHLEGTPSEILECPDITIIYSGLFLEEENLKTAAPDQEQTAFEEADRVDRFNRLYGGDFSDYPSQSEADLALCVMLAKKTDGNFDEMDKLFRDSGLYRDKWEREEYRQQTLKRAVASVKEGELRKTDSQFNLTDLGNSQRLIEKYSSRIRYIPSAKDWVVWNGKYWEWDEKARVKEFARDVVGDLYIEAAEASYEKRAEIAKHATKTESMSRLNAMVSMAKDEHSIRVGIEGFDTDDWLINCDNGVLDLKTGKILPHSSGQLFTKMVPVPYDPDANCQAWEEFLNVIMDGDKEMVNYLQRAVGYGLTGSTREQCFFILYGSGANGKSTFLAPLMNLLNDYAMQSPPETFLNLNRRGVNNDIARLRGARFVIATEPEANQAFAESVLKQVTGGDKITARYLHQEYFDFQPKFKLFLATNHKPTVTGRDKGIWRRIRLIPFEITIPKEEEDHQLVQKLNMELQGIFAWAVRGCIAWQKNGLGEPEAVKEATAQYAKEMDILARYIDDNCELGRRLKATTKDLYADYSRWCEQEGEEKLSRVTFGRQLNAKKLKPYRTTNERGWKGIGLKSQFTINNIGMLAGSTVPNRASFRPSA